MYKAFNHLAFNYIVPLLNNIINITFKKKEVMALISRLKSRVSEPIKTMKKINGIYNVLKTWDIKVKDSTQTHYVRRVGERNPEEYTTITCSSDDEVVFINYEDSMKNSILIKLYPGRIRSFLIDIALNLKLELLHHFLMRYHTDVELTISGKIYQIPKNHLFFGINHLHLENYIMFEKEDPK